MIIDLTHTVRNGMPVYPESFVPEIVNIELYDDYGFHVQKITMDGHTGTHIDVPAHMVPEGSTTDSMDISSFFGTGKVIDCSAFVSDSIIGGEVLDRLDNDEVMDFLLLFTGNAGRWNSKEYFTGFPVPSKELVDALVDLKIKGIGIDTVSVDPVDSKDYPNHRRILGSEIVIIENLKNLEMLKGKSFKFACFPLKLQSGDGSPVRAVGIIDD